MTEAAHFKGEHIFVVGGANSAGQGALFFSLYAKKVTMLVRGSMLEKGMSRYLVDQIEAIENIEVRLFTEVIGVAGDRRLETITVRHMVNEEVETLPAKGLFLFIGAVPHSDMVARVVERNRTGFIPTGQDLQQNGRWPNSWKLRRDPYYLETSVPGIFAVGDIRQGATRRVASAVGEGAIAVRLVHQYLKSV
jgi:thioredoxin reductase (NADPH)